jgi:hypothetical protein
MGDIDSEGHSANGGALRFGAWSLFAFVVAATALVFIALVTAPMANRTAGGFLGAETVAVYALIAGLFAIQWTLLRGSRFFESTDDEATFDRHARVALFLLFLAAVVVFNASFRGAHHPGLVPGHDQPQYYAYLHSWVFDQDLTFENEYRAIPGAWAFMQQAHPERPDFNVAPIGAPLLWLPFYLAGHGVVLGMNHWQDASWPADGIAAPYAVAAVFGSIAVAFAGLLLTHASLRTRIGPRSSFGAVLLIAVGTPLVFYVIDHPLMSHAPSFFAGALALYCWTRIPERSSKTAYAALGGSIGLAMLVRPSHAVLLVLPVTSAVASLLRSEPSERRTKALGVGLAAFLSILTAMLVFGLQLAVWYARNGFESPPGSPMEWTSPSIVQVLFSAQNGLFAWHPITYAGFLGLPLVWRKSREWCIGLAAVLVLTTYCNAAIASWWGGESFGMRRFTGVLPFMAPGVAMLGGAVYRLVQRKPVVLIGATAALLLAWNASLIAASRQGPVWLSHPKTFDRVWQGVATRVHETVGNPFSMPANLWFAWRHGATPGQYDFLSGERREEFFGVPVLGPDGKVDLDAVQPVQGLELKYFLGRGWNATEAAFNQHGGRWCAHAQVATLLVPAKDGQAYRLELTVEPPKNFDAPQAIRVYWNDRPVASDLEISYGRLSAVAMDVPAAATVDGVNTVRIELRDRRSFIPRPTGGQSPGAGLTVRTWEPRTETLYLQGVKLIPVASEPAAN